MLLTALRRIILKNQHSPLNRTAEAGQSNRKAEAGPANRRAEAGLSNRRAEAGNIFAMLFGGVALVGVLGASTMQFIRGPLTTAVNVNRATTAETQMVTSTQLAMSTAAGQANDGDCDGDTMVEPLPWKDAGSKPAPNNAGGHLPGNIGTSKSDPWGTEYGYCVWDHGTDIKNGECSDDSRRLAGGNTKAQIALAIISAGKDRKFETSCNEYVDSDADGEPDTPLVDKADGADDLIYTRTYSEAGGELWRIVGAGDQLFRHRDD